MYTLRAKKDIPERVKGSHMLVLTKAATKRLNKFYRYIKELELSTPLTGAILGVCDAAYVRFSVWDLVPSLDIYFRMMKIMRITLTKKDINYAYAHRIYSAEDIARRIKRLNLLEGVRHHSKDIGYSGLARSIGLSVMHVFASLTYRRKSTTNGYAQCMFWIAEQEKIRGYDDRLIFER